MSGNWSGELTLRVETDTAAVNVMYSNLRNHFFGECRVDFSLQNSRDLLVKSSK